MIVTFMIVVGIFLVLFGFVVIFGAPYVPSQKKYTRRLFEHIHLGAKDVVIDVGSGDGLVLRLAAERGALAIGYEINPLLVVISRLLSLHDKKISVKLANFWTIQIPAETTLVYVFAVSRDGKRLIMKMQKEANRLNKTLKVACYGSPLTTISPDSTFEAYSLYSFQPLHSKKAQV